MKRAVVSYILIGLYFVLIPLTNFSQNLGGKNHTEILKFSESVNKSKLCFIVNKGQWPNEVKYMAKLNNLNIWVTDSDIILDFYKDKFESGNKEGINRINNSDIDKYQNAIRYGQVIKMKVSISDIKEKSIVKGNFQQKGLFNYFLGNSPSDWYSGVPSFSELIMQNLISDLKIRLYFDSNCLKYDVIIPPNTDINNLKIEINGQNGLNVTKENKLTINSELGNIEQRNLYAYQLDDGVKRKVNCNFKIFDNNKVGFDIGTYNKSLPLIIDPLIYSTFIGGAAYDDGWTIALDTLNNTYIAGTTGSANYPTTSGAYKTSFTGGGSFDAYVTKLNPTGTSLIYSTYLGGNDIDYGLGINVMPNGEAVVAGKTASTNFPVTSGAFQTSNGGGASDVFVTRLNSTGSALIYSTYIGGNGTDYANHIKLDQNGNVYLTGLTGSTNFPTTNGCYRSYNSGSIDVFVAKLNSNGNSLGFSTYIGGSAYDEALDLTFDSSGNVYVVGYTSSTNFPVTSSAYQKTFGGGTYDGLIVKFNSNASSLLFSSYFGKSGDEKIFDIILDQNNNLIFTGNTTSSSFQATSGAYQTSYGGTQDGFVAKMNSQGSSLLIFSYLGGSGSDDPRGLVLDGYGNVYISGTTASTNFPVTNCSYQQSYGGGSSDLFLTKMNSSLSDIIYSTLIGGNNADQLITDINLDRNGNVIVCARTNSTNFPVTSGAYNTSYSGGSDDVAVIKMDMTYPSSSIYTGTLSTTTFCGGGTVSVPFSSSCPFNYGNIFTVQLSDSNGSFNNPLTISSVQGFRAGTITAKIPDSLSSGSMYKIRVVSTDPFAIGTQTSQNITIGPKPNADFSINDTTQCLLNNSFSFTNNSTISKGNIALNIWNFGDGGNYTITNPNHTYVTANNYNVKLVTISDMNCRDTITKKVYIDGFKKVAFDINDSTQCLKTNQFTFTNKTSGVGTITYLWTVGYGNSISTTDASSSYTYDSTYSIILRAYSDFGCADSTTKKVYVYPDPHVDFYINNPDQCFRKQYFAFTNHSSITTGSLKYLWNFGDGDTSTSQNVQHKYNGIHSYFVKLWITSDHGCKDSLTKTVFLRYSPTASFTVSDTIMCFNNNRFVFTNYSTIASGVLDYVWKFQDTTYCFSKDTVHVFGWADTFDVVMRAISDWGCMDSMVKRIIVKPAPDADFICKPSFDQCFRGNIFNFKNQSKVPNGSMDYYWDLGDGTKTTDPDVVHSYASVGSYPVKLVAYNNKNCRDSITKTANINPDPKVKFEMNDSAQCLKGNSFIFNNKTTISTGTLYYFWSFGDGGFSMTKNCTHSYTYADTFEVKLTALSNIGCNDSLIKDVVISSGPKINLGNDTILADTQSITLNAGAGNDKYVWSTGAKTSQIILDSTGIGLHSRMIWVIVTKDSCSSKDSIKITFIHINDIPEGTQIGKLTIFPNPTSGELNFKQQGKEITDLQVTDLLGKVCFQQPFRTTLNIENFPAGIYIVNALNQKGLVVQQFKVIKY